MSLLEETINILKEENKTPDDILWCGSKTFGYFTWNDFERIADTQYDSGYGGQEVATDLLIVGKNFWLERHEYDGSEWWEYKEQPTKPDNKINLLALTRGQARKLDFDDYPNTLKSVNGL